MQRCGFTPYEGKKPYIFVSYAHKDSDRVFPILEELNRRGYRVWYDDGIAPGSEWPENIAQHLDGCSLTLAFISPSSIASANCRREVTFALSKRKPFLGILLQPTEMSLGMEMQLSAQQCIMKYTYATEEAFYEKVCSCPDLAPCLGQPVPAAKPAPAPAEPAKPAPAPVPKPQPQQPGKPLDKKLIGIIAGVAAALVLVLVLATALGGKGDENLEHSGDQGSQSSTPVVPGPGDTQPSQSEPTTTEPGDTVPTGPTDETMVVYRDQVITAKDVAYINRQSQLITVFMENCIIQAGAFDKLQLAPTVESIEMINCTGVTNLHSLADMEQLRRLIIRSCGITDADMSRLCSQELWDVDISGNPEFSNLDIFADCTGIVDINFSNTAVASVEALEGAEGLGQVMGNNTQVKNLTVLANKTTLWQLHFANCGIEAISPIYSLELSTLDLSGNQLKDLEFLTYCTRLSNVNLSYNALESADTLEKSVNYLRTLHLGGNTELYYFHLEWLNQCHQLEALNLDGCYLTNLNMLSNLENLVYLSAVDCSITDVSGIQNLRGLGHLILAFNRITDVSPLAQVVNAYMSLDLSFNNGLKDVSALPATAYWFLNLTNVDLDPYSLQPACGAIVVLAYDEAWMDEACLRPNDDAFFDRVAMIACPLDKVMDMKDYFGEGRICFINEDAEYLALLEEYEIDCDYVKIAFQK